MENTTTYHCEDCNHCRVLFAPTCNLDGHTVNRLDTACGQFTANDRSTCGQCHFFASNYCTKYDEATKPEYLVTCVGYEPKIQL